MRSKRVRKRGVAAVEMLVGIAIASLILIFTTYAIMSFVSAGRDIADKTQALYLAEEALEVVKFLRDGDWDTLDGLSDNTRYYLDIDPTTIGLNGSPEIVGIFRRSFYVTDVYRNNTDEIVASTTAGSSADSGSKYVTAVVTWGTPTSTVELTTIIADIAP